MKIFKYQMTGIEEDENVDENTGVATSGKIRAVSLGAAKRALRKEMGRQRLPNGIVWERLYDKPEE